MFYKNSLSNLVFNAMSDFSKDIISSALLLRAIRQLDYDALCAVSSFSDSLLTDAVNLTSPQNTTSSFEKCIYIIKHLLIQADLIDEKATSFLLTHQNARHLTPVSIYLYDFDENPDFYFNSLSLASQAERETLPLKSPVNISISTNLAQYFDKIHTILYTQWMPKCWYYNLISHSDYAGYRPLDQLIKLNDIHAMQLYLIELRLAFTNEWIDPIEYKDLLLGHLMQGCTPLHEVIMTGDLPKTKLYFNELLYALEKKVISYDDYRNFLMTENRAGFTHLHQAINTPATNDEEAVHIALYFLHTFYLTLKKEDYIEALHKESSSPRRRKPVCDYHKPFGNSINFFMRQATRQPTMDPSRFELDTSPCFFKPISNNKPSPRSPNGLMIQNQLFC